MKNKDEKLEVRDVKAPLLVSYKDICYIMCIICSGFITDKLHCVGVLVFNNNSQLIWGSITSMAFISGLLIWVIRKLLRMCYLRVKRRAE